MPLKKRKCRHPTRQRPSSLPNELLIDIIRSCPAADLLQLNLACKRINALVEPVLWADIELHGGGYHESPAELNEPAPFRAPSQRLYRIEKKDVPLSYPQHYAQRFFQMLQVMHARDLTRVKELAARVRNLCTVIDPEDLKPDECGLSEDEEESVDVWHLLPYFSNLEVLELHGDYSLYFYDEVVFEPDTPPLPNLRFAKLSGYIPCDVARWITQAGATLERLELGMLDRPIPTDDHSDPDSPSLPEDDIDDDEPYWGGEGYADAVIPRPLSGFLPDREEDLALPNLKHLSLHQPLGKYYQGHGFHHCWSKSAEKACLADWRRVLWASNQTLETLVLEQQPAAERETDGDEEVPFLLEDQDGLESQPLLEMVEELLAREGAFPALRRMFLYGIAVGEESEEKTSHRTPGGRFMRFLERRGGIGCEARLGKWCQFDYVEGFAFVTDWDGEGDEYREQYAEEHGLEIKWDTVLASV